MHSDTGRPTTISYTTLNKTHKRLFIHGTQCCGAGDCDTAAIEAIKHLTGWKPSQLNGKKVIANMALPVNFTPNVK